MIGRLFSLQPLIRDRLVFLAGAAVLLAITLAGINLNTSRIVTEIDERHYQLGRMVEHQALADMMHDALRGDAYHAVLQGQKGAAATGAESEIVTALAEHRAMLAEMLAANNKLAIAVDLPDVTTAIGDAEAALVPYANAAERIVETAFRDLDAVDAQMGPFQQTFEQLETKMAGVTALIGAERDRTIEETARIHSIGQMTALGAFVLGTLFIVVLAYLTTRSTVKPLTAMVDAMNGLAAGETTVDIPYRSRRDELGAMAKAVQVFKDNAIEKQRLEVAAEAEANRQRLAAEEQRRIENAAGDEIAKLASTAAAGDLSMRIDLNGKTGFFRTLGESMNKLSDAVSSAVGEVATMMAAMAQGDLSRRVTGDYQGEFLKLKDDANATADKLAEIVGQTAEGMANIKTATTQISAGSTDLSSRTEEQVTSLTEVAAAIREMSVTVKQNAENAQQASQLALTARVAADTSGQVAASAVEAVGQIQQSSKKISEIIGLMDEIAFQTNLLALNAAVEAARAGDAGRGFAVVAQEVRTLAQRSSQASKEIKGLIGTSGDHVERGVGLVNQAGERLGEIVTSTKRVADIVSEIAAASQEQSGGIGQVEDAINQMETMTQKNASLVEETTASLDSVNQQVEGLLEVAGFFTGMDDLKPMPRAAGHDARKPQQRLAVNSR